MCKQKDKTVQELLLHVVMATPKTVPCTSDIGEKRVVSKLFQRHWNWDDNSAGDGDAGLERYCYIVFKME